MEQVSNGKNSSTAVLTAQPSPIEVHDLTVTYNTKPVLWDIDFELPEGKLIAIMGPNGAGKSTLIKAMLDLIPISNGWVKIYGQPCYKARKNIAYVPQRESVDWDFPITALDVVNMGRYGKLGWLKRPQQKDWTISRTCLDKLGLSDLADRQISQLSGGQQQRVFLARALAQEANIYMMDEPFAAVDAVTEKAIVEILFDLRKQGKTVLVVHHDLQTVPEYFDWIVLVNMRLVALGPVSVAFNEENLRKTYGGRLAILSKAAEALARKKV